MATPQGRRLRYRTPGQVSSQEPPDARHCVLTATLLGGKPCAAPARPAACRAPPPGGGGGSCPRPAPGACPARPRDSSPARQGTPQGIRGPALPALRPLPAALRRGVILRGARHSLECPAPGARHRGRTTPPGPPAVPRPRGGGGPTDGRHSGAASGPQARTSQRLQDRTCGGSV